MYQKKSSGWWVAGQPAALPRVEDRGILYELSPIYAPTRAMLRTLMKSSPQDLTQRLTDLLCTGASSGDFRPELPHFFGVDLCEETLTLCRFQYYQHRARLGRELLRNFLHSASRAAESDQVSDICSQRSGRSLIFNGFQLRSALWSQTVPRLNSTRRPCSTDAVGLKTESVVET